jgi:hypothetical protein
VKAQKVSSHVPTVPTEPVTLGGTTLNRYYFVRKGDTAESISQKIFGNTDMKEKLAAWNGSKRAWMPGHFVMYPSAQTPTDAKMASFHTEAGTTPTPYKVKAGETLSTIAKEQYGDIRSWTEIAVDSSIRNPDQIAVGTLLVLFPGEVEAAPQVTASNSQNSQGSGKSTQVTQEYWQPDHKIGTSTMVASAPVTAPAATAAQATAPAANGLPQARGNVAVADNAKLLSSSPAPMAAGTDKMDRTPITASMAQDDLPVPGKVTPTVNDAHDGKSSPASMEIVKFVQHNLFMVMMALGAMGFLFYAALLKIRRNRADNEF